MTASTAEPPDTPASTAKEPDLCHWGHTSDPERTYACFDGKSRVCARCCVEHCRRVTPRWFAECSAAGHPTWPAKSPESTPPAKLVVLESYWDGKVFGTRSVQGFLEALGPILSPPLAVAHRFVESQRGLDYYTRHPDGLLWTDPRAWDAPVFYLAFHGSPGKMHSVLDNIGARALCRAFEGYGVYPVLIYFASCSMFRGRRGMNFARSLLASSGAKAVVGYKTEINWMQSMLVDLLFLSRFYASADPWSELPAIAASVRRDLPLARTLGWTLLTANDAPPPADSDPGSSAE